MRLRRLCLLLVSLPLSLLIVFSGVSIKAAAITVPSGGHYMTVSETREFLGDSIEVSYFNGSDYVSSSASYYSSGSYNFTEYSESPVGFVAGSHLWVQYTLYVPNLILNPDYIQIKINPTYSIFDTEYIYTAFALSSYGRISTTYSSPQCNWYKGGSVLNFQNTTPSDSSGDYHSYLYPEQWSPLYYTYQFSYIPVVMSSNSTFSAYAMDCNFYGNDSGGGNDSYKYTFWVMCPYVSGNAIGASGTFGTSVSSDINVNVDVDMSETNGLLGDILDGLSGIGSTISGLFVPSPADMSDFYEDLVDELDSAFSGYSDSTDILDDVKDTIGNANPVSSITFPRVSVPSTELSIGPYTVDLAPDSDLLDYVRLAVDLVATCAFINLIRLKFDEIIHGKVVVESGEVEMS